MLLAMAMMLVGVGLFLNGVLFEVWVDMILDTFDLDDRKMAAAALIITLAACVSPFGFLYGILMVCFVGWWIA